MSLLVSELESLKKDGGWERAALPGKFLSPGLEKCPGRTQEQSRLHRFSRSGSLLCHQKVMEQKVEKDFRLGLCNSYKGVRYWRNAL